MGFTTFSLKMFLVEPWDQNGESTVDQKKSSLPII